MQLRVKNYTTDLGPSAARTNTSLAPPRVTLQKWKLSLTLCGGGEGGGEGGADVPGVSGISRLRR